MERDRHPKDEDEFEVIESDEPFPHVIQKYIDISGTNDLEKTIERLDRVQRRQGHCDNVRLKIGEDHHFLKDLMILDNPDALENLRISLANKAVFGHEENTLKLSFEENANGAQKSKRPFLVIFDPSPHTLLAHCQNVKSVMNKGLTQRLLLPINSNGMGISQYKFPRQKFAVLATPSIRVENGKAGALNWHVAMPENVDLSSNSLHTIFRLRNIASQIKPPVMSSRYSI